MNSVIEAVVGILMILGIGVASSSAFHSAVKRQTLTLVYKQLHRHGDLEAFTRRLTDSSSSTH